MSIFGSSNLPTKLNGVRISQSKQGYAIPVVLGCQKIQQSLIWLDGLNSTEAQSNSGGGGKGGGKGDNEYLYTADVITALCAGPVTAIGNVWAGQTWLANEYGSDSITLAYSVYTPAYATTLLADNGVGIATTYSGSYTDYGAPAATVLGGTNYSPLILVPYGTTLTAGEYSVNPASIGTFAVTSCTTASGGSTTYTGTFTGGTSPYTSGASNNYAGFAFAISGFANAANNGSFTCSASTATSITVNNAAGVAQTATASAASVGNTYHFAASNIGKTLEVSYQYQLTQFMAQETDLITSSHAIYPGGNNGPQIDFGVAYYNNGNSLDGKALTAVSGTPTLAGTYSFTSNNSSAPEYQFASGDIGNEVLITWSYQNLNAVASPAPTTLNFELFEGTQGQSAAEYLYSGEAMGYTGIAYLLFAPMSLGTDAEIQDNVFEVLTGGYSYGGGIVDCNPVTCIQAVLTNPMWGLGSGQVPFPVSTIDNGASGTWGAPATAGTQSANSTAWNWFAAQNYFISPVIDSQDSAASTMSKWLEAGMCAAFMSEGMMKLVPYGDTSAAGNGCTWIAPTESIVSLDDTCFIAKDGEDPVKIERSAWQDANNKVQVQFKNRSNQYADEIVQESDQGAINRYGLRLEDPQDWDFITTLPTATFAASMRVKRSVNIRNTYTFSVPYNYSYLEPMDIINITTSSLWAVNSNNISLGIITLPVRITKVVDDPKDGLEIACEDYLWGVHQPSIYNKEISTGTALLNSYSQPGNSEVVMFEATSRLTQYQGNQIWIGAAGQSRDWGSCNVWVSQDGTKYLQVGTISTPARLGTLAAAMVTGPDPDTVQNLVIELIDNSAPLESATELDANSNNTMCFVDGEIISYSTCALTGNNTFTMSGYLRRGQMGSTIGAHAMGALFMRLDSAVLKYTYDPTWAGQTLYFKFQSVNWAGNCAQDLSTLTAVAFTVPGLNPGTVSASTGLIEQGALVGNGTSTLLNGQGSIIPNQNVVYTTSCSPSTVGSERTIAVACRWEYTDG